MPSAFVFECSETDVARKQATPGGPEPAPVLHTPVASLILLFRARQMFFFFRHDQEPANRLP